MELLNAFYTAMAVAPFVMALWAWLTEEPVTQEELERASMRSYSWPSKPGQDAFSTGLAAKMNAGARR